MATRIFNQDHRPRELRRRVVLPARVRNGAAWSDACILNVSSRGMLIQSSRASSPGTQIELHRGHHVIVARVVWREGARVGLQVDDPLPVEDILSISQAPGLQLTAAPAAAAERRKKPRDLEASRQQSRAMEFAAVAFIGAALSAGIYTMVEAAFAQPLIAVEAALGG